MRVVKNRKGGNNMYLWTDKAEKEAKEKGLDERKAGTQAMFGGEPLTGGMTATAWKEKGYIEEV